MGHWKFNHGENEGKQTTAINEPLVFNLNINQLALWASASSQKVNFSFSAHSRFHLLFMSINKRLRLSPRLRSYSGKGPTKPIHSMFALTSLFLLRRFLKSSINHKRFIPRNYLIFHFKASLEKIHRERSFFYKWISSLSHYRRLCLGIIAEWFVRFANDMIPGIDLALSLIGKVSHPSGVERVRDCGLGCFLKCETSWVDNKTLKFRNWYFKWHSYLNWSKTEVLFAIEGIGIGIVFRIGV